MYLLDTDTILHLHAGHPKVVARLRQVEDAEVGTTVVTKIEILRARYDFLLKAKDGDDTLKAQELLTRTEELLANLLVLPFDVRVKSHFDEFRKRRKLKKIGRADVLIASIAHANRATLVTRNLKHFRQMPELMLENWVD